MAESVQATNYIRLKVEAVCKEAGLPANSPVREALLAEAVVVDGARPGDFFVRAQKADGSDVPLETRLAEFRDDPKTAKHFPGQKPIEISAKVGTQNLSDHFSDIAAGRVKVVD